MKSRLQKVQMPTLKVMVIQSMMELATLLHLQPIQTAFTSKQCHLLHPQEVGRFKTMSRLKV